MLTVLLNGAVVAAAFRLAQRRGRAGALQATCDAFLLYFLVQYAAVALPGVCGVFNLWTMSAVGFTAAASMWWGAGQIDQSAPQVQRAVRARPIELDRLGLIACALFAGAYLGIYAYIQRPMPPVATDSLVYHLPTAVQWIQTGRLGIYPTWYWNPAASYSPATGSTFMAWWMAPVGNEVFVRFVQAPPLMWIFFLVARMVRLMGGTRTVAGLIGVAAALSRPLFSEALVQKDDLYVTAFVAAGVLSLAGDLPRDRRLGPWRIGVTLGFVLASKYTALLACPVFLFMIDAPLRARWRVREWCIVVGTVLAMAAPWYVRNAVLTGNPLYPVDVRVLGIHLPGLFTTERDQQLRAAGGVWRMLAQTYHSLPTVAIVLLAVAWIASWIAAGRAVLREPLQRACVLGSVATLAIFLVTSPHHEVRYVFPLIVLWFAAAGMAIARGIPTSAFLWQIGAAGALAVASTLTSFSTLIVAFVLGLSAAALLVAGVGAGLVAVSYHFQFGRRSMYGVGATAVVAFTMYAFVEWSAYVDACRQLRGPIWQRSDAYPDQAGAWQFVAEQVPADATVAYANTFFVYPLYGYDYNRRVVYAPVRRGLHDFLHFPRMGDRVPGDLIVNAMTQTQDADADRATWLENLRALGATHLLVAKLPKEQLDPHPPELAFARSDPARFTPVYEDEQTVVFRIAKE